MRLELPEHLSEYTARAATLDDAPGVAACVHAAYRHYVARNGMIPVPMRLDYEDVIRTSPVTVVEHGGGVVGVLVLTVGTEGFLLDNIAVQPAHQGKGLGRCLLGYAESEAVRQGFGSIYLFAQEVMTENIALYERAGYVEYARRTELGLHRVYLRKQLARTAPG